MKKLMQFLGIWLLIALGFIWFGLWPHSHDVNKQADALFESAIVAGLIYASYWMGYDKGAEDMKAGKNKNKKEGLFW